MTYGIPTNGIANVPSTSPELTALLDNLKAKRLDPETQMRKYLAVTAYIAKCDGSSSISTRVLCRGDVHPRNDKSHPAVLVYHPTSRQVAVYAPYGEDDTMVPYDVDEFFSNIPYVGIAKEVLDGPETSMVGSPPS